MTQLEAGRTSCVCLNVNNNAVGAMAVGEVRNRESIDKTALKRFLILVLIRRTKAFVAHATESFGGRISLEQ